MPCCGWPISPWTYLPVFERKRNEIRDAMVTKDNKTMLVNLVIGNFVDWMKSDVLKQGNEFNNANYAKYSPINGKMKGLCPMYFSVGASEMLLDDTLRFAEMLYKQRVEVSVEVCPYLCHVFIYFQSDIFRQSLCMNL